MDKQGSHTNQTPENNPQSNSAGMSTRGAIHKDTMAGGTASVSLNSGLTSALSRAPSPFEGRREPVIETPPQPDAAQSSQAPLASEAVQTPNEAQQISAYPEARYPEAGHERHEPHFGHTPAQPAQEIYGEEPHNPSMDEIYANEQHYVDQGGGHGHTEATPYPGQYHSYQDGMNDVFDEANEKPQTRRTSFLLLSALAIIAMVAGGVIYFYKSSTEQTAAKQDVPVIKAENEPTKITPEKPGGIEIPHQKKLIYDRITGENSESTEQIVSREEQVAPLTPAGARAEAQSTATGNPFDQQNTADAPVQAPSGAEPIAKAQLPPGVTLPSNQQVANVEVQTSAPVAINTPVLSNTPPTASGTTSGDYLIQIASFRSQEEAVRNYENLNRKYSGLLSSYGPMIQRADLGSRGIYYRLRIGPMANKETATNLCANLLAQGQKDCLVRRK